MRCIKPKGDPMKMRLVFDKEYDMVTGKYKVRVRELDLDDELKAVVDAFEPSVRIRGEEMKLSELLEKTFESPTREDAEKTMGEIRGALVESLSVLIARFKEAQGFNGSVVYEIDFNEL
jgi:predicted Holliday junction resolvase-like endonuclease